MRGLITEGLLKERRFVINFELLKIYCNEIIPQLFEIQSDNFSKQGRDSSFDRLIRRNPLVEISW